ncbi:MAG TPA: hypothetical protein DEQ34_04535 [Balneolaceae bacterium]|nr:hypothetical protein [Balneolaceae bacterium]|tara:strand:- start:142951 stop:144711 length:1761 start_codon:yes stop_codon:yes gene_type:complete
MPYDYIIGIYESGDYRAELHEWTEVDVQPEYKDFRIQDEFHATGRAGEPFATHLRGEIQLSIYDSGNYYRDKFKDFAPGRYYLKIVDGDSTRYGWPISSYISSKFWKSTTIKTFIFSDGITTLKAQPNDYTSPIELGDFFYQLLADIGVELPLNVLFNYKHYGAVGTAGLEVQQVQIMPSDFVHHLKSPTKYDVLMAVLNHFKNLQIWQQDGEWYIAQRSARSSSETWARCVSGAWSTYSASPDLSIARQDVRSQSTEDMEFPGVNSITRDVTLKPIPFETLNPQFAEWDTGDPESWEVNGSSVQIIGPPTGVRINNDTDVVAQVLPRILYGNSTVRCQVEGSIRFVEGMPTNDYTGGVARIKQTNMLTGTVSYLKNDGTLGSDEFLSVTQFLNGSAVDTTFNFDIEFEAGGAFFVYELILQFDGDTSAIGYIEYYNVELSPVNIESQKVSVSYLAEQNTFSLFESETDSAYLDDLSKINYDPGIYFWDGSNWQKAEDWSNDGSAINLHSVVLKDYLEQLSKVNQGYRLQLPLNFSSDLTSLATVWIDSGKQFTVYYRSRSLGSRSQILELCELSSGSATAGQVVE